MRKAPWPRRRWRREVLLCWYDGKSLMHSPRLRAVLAAVHWGRCTRFALPHASSITRESPGVVAQSLPMFESKVLRRPAANYALKLRSCNGSRQHFPNCCVRATSTEAQMRDNSVLTLRFCRSMDSNRRQLCPGPTTSRVMTALSGWSRRRVRSRTSPGPAPATGRAGLSRHKTQYKCGNSRFWHNHPLGKPRYDQRLLLAPALLLSLE